MAERVESIVSCNEGGLGEERQSVLATQMESEKGGDNREKESWNPSDIQRIETERKNRKRMGE